MEALGMFTDRVVSLSSVTATVLWVLTFMFLLAGTLTGVTHPVGVGFAVALALTAHGLACSAAAATVTIRNLLLQQSGLIHEAFEHGRETAPVRRVH